MHVVVGGHSTLSPGDQITATIQHRPNEGESIDLSTKHSFTLNNSALLFSLDVDQMNRGSQGKVKFTLQNTSAITTELITARSNASLPSNEVRLELRDLSNNVLNVKPVKIFSGEGIVTVPNGEAIVRVNPGQLYTSPWIDFEIPSATPVDAKLVLVVDKFHYAVGTDNHISITGHGVSKNISLTDSPYSGQITSISPQISWGNDDIVIRGKAIAKESGEPAPFQPLDLVLRVSGFERKFQVTTSSSGEFEYKYEPTASENGTYQVSVLYPGAFERPAHGTFTINGVAVSPTIVTMHLPRNFETDLNVSVTAATTGTVNNLRLALRAQDQPLGILPRGINVVFPPAISLTPGETRTMSLKVSGDNTADPNGLFKLSALSDSSGATPFSSIAITYAISDAAAHPVFSSNVLRLGVKQNATASASVTLSNQGFAPLLSSTLSLIRFENDNPAPNWVYLVSPPSIPTLEVGGTSQITVAATTDGSTQLGHHTFRVRLLTEGKPAVYLPVDISVSQDGLGSTIVHVADIYTATLDTNGIPIAGLQGAKVTLQHEDLPEVKYEATSDLQGEARFNDILPGPYFLRASASNHNDNSKRIVIQPGFVSTESIFLLNGLVTIEWSVVEITIEDRYEIVLDAIYETNVPAPVLVFEPVQTQLPDLKKGEVFYGELRLTNYGLIKTFGVTSALPSSDEKLKYEFFGTIPAELGAKESVIVPYRITALQDMNPAADAGATGGGSCLYSNTACANGFAICASGDKISTGACTYWTNSRECPGPTNPGGITGGGGGPTGGGSWSPSGDSLPGMPPCLPGYNCGPGAGPPNK